MKYTLFLLLFILGWNLNVFSQYHEDDFDYYLEEFSNFFNLEESQLTENGHVIINMGSARSGRYAFFIQEVEFQIETRAKEPGCADICPERTLLYIKCKENRNCIYDPILPDLTQNQAIAEIIPVKQGVYAYLFLLDLKEYFLQISK